MSDINKKKLFIPRKLSDDDSRYSEWNNSQKMVDGKRINQYDSEGRKQGIWEERDDDDDVYYDEIGKGLYLNNERNGVWVFYYLDGQIFAKGQYVGGLPNGIWEYYNKISGELEGKTLFNNGKFVDVLPLTESKKLFIPRKLSGEGSRWEQWNKEQPVVDGVQINQYDLDGEKDGVWLEFYDDDDELYGTIESKQSYKNGKKDGIWEYYLESGELYYRNLYKNDKYVKILPKEITESKTPSFLLKEEMVLIREGNVQDYINNVISKIKNLPYETKKKYLTIAISTLLGYTSYPVIQSIFDKSPDKEAKEIVRRVMDKKDKVSMFNDGTKFRLSKKGFQHIMDEEKPKLIAYALGDGKITVGYGHAEPVATTKLKVGQKITKEQAKLYLKEDLKIAADGVRRMFRDWKKQNKNYKITQDMFDALVSMAFNMGVSGLRNTNLVDHLRDGDYKTAGQLIKKTNIDNDSFPGLEKRRYKESDMFLSYLSKPTNVNT
jgi:lysozyme